MLNMETGLGNEALAPSVFMDQSNEEALKKEILEMRSYLVDFITRKGFKDDADDIVQIALVKGINGIKKFKGDSALKTWLTTIALNELRMKLRADKSRGGKKIAYEDGVKTETEDTTDLPDPLFQKRIDEAMQTLKPEEQELLKLSLQNPDLKTAEKLNLPISTVKRKLRAIRRKIRKNLADKGIDISELGISNAQL